MYHVACIMYQLCTLNTNGANPVPSINLTVPTTVGTEGVSKMVKNSIILALLACLLIMVYFNGQKSKDLKFYEGQFNHYQSKYQVVSGFNPDSIIGGPCYYKQEKARSLNFGRTWYWVDDNDSIIGLADSGSIKRLQDQQRRLQQ